MKKLILSTVALAALTFASCKKDNLQPTTNLTTSIEQLNNETETNDDKVVDARNKFVGTWKRVGQNILPFKAKISKTTNNRLKITQTFSDNVQEVIYAKIGSNKLVFSSIEIFDGTKRTTTGIRSSTNAKKMSYKIVEVNNITETPITTLFNLVKQ